MELYFMVHPGSPSAVRRPRLIFRAGCWRALLGDSLTNRITGLGQTVEEALSAFDVSYLSTLHPPDGDGANRQRPISR